jgi:hypothetical protein
MIIRNAPVCNKAAFNPFGITICFQSYDEVQDFLARQIVAAGVVNNYEPVKKTGLRANRTNSANLFISVLERYNKHNPGKKILFR